jgi:hypothetical protein
MAGLFPGMDPYLEFRSPWPDFPNALIAEIRNELGARLPDSYVARVDERIEVVTPGTDPPRSYRPDIAVTRSPEGGSVSATAGAGAATGVLEPELVEVLRQDPEELRLTWVQISALPDLELVTVIEVLSPINKSWQGRGSYLQKPDRLHAARVNLVEIDLLLGGAPLPMKGRSVPGGYSAIVARAARLPLAEVYRWTVRDALPSVPIPLRDPDPDVGIDLAALVARVYDLGRYARTLRHDQPLPDTAPLSPDDRSWVESVVRHGLRG